MQTVRTVLHVNQKEDELPAPCLLPVSLCKTAGSEKGQGPCQARQEPPMGRLAGQGSRKEGRKGRGRKRRAARRCPGPERPHAGELEQKTFSPCKGLLTVLEGSGCSALKGPLFPVGHTWVSMPQGSLSP